MTLLEVAVEAGVSTATVSRMLSTPMAFACLALGPRVSGAPAESSLVRASSIFCRESWRTG